MPMALEVVCSKPEPGTVMFSVGHWLRHNLEGYSFSIASPNDSCGVGFNLQTARLVCWY